jgi:hypothetical protein
MKKIIGIIVFIILLGCGGSNTTIVESWRDPNTSVANQQFKKILVVAILENEVTRRIVETKFHELNPGFRVSYNFLHKGNKDMTPEMIGKLLQLENFDGVVTLRLVDTFTETDYVPGMNISMYYGIYGVNNFYGGMFGGWYGNYSAFYYDPGFYVQNTYYFIETNVFSLNENKLIWSGTTKSSNVQGKIAETAGFVIEEITKQMRKDGSLPPKPKK